MSGRLICPRCNSTYHSISHPPRSPGICDVCSTALIQRVDDREETVRQRLRVYHENTASMIAYYRSQGLLCEVDGVGTIEEIYANILQVLKQAAPPC